MMILSMTPFQCTAVPPASAAPTRPPNSACEEDEGRPKYQVIRFQKIAPTSAAKRMAIPVEPLGVSIRPSLTVLATPEPRNAPARFMTAAIASAARGVSARVDTDVAMAFAESWKPFVYVKKSATAMVTTRTRVSMEGSGLLDGDGLHRVRHVLERVRRLLQHIHDLLELQHLDRVVLAVEELCKKLSVDLVRLVLQTVHLDPVLGEVVHGAQVRHGLGRQLRRPRQDLDLLLDALGQFLDVVEDDQVDGLLHEVHDVVEGRREGVDVLAVERRDERGVQLVEDRMGGVVTCVFRGPHTLCD